MSKVLTYDHPTDLCLSRRTVLMPGPLPKYPIQLTPEQERYLQQLSNSYTAPFAEVQRARILLLAHQYPTRRMGGLAGEGGCCARPVKQGRRRGQQPAGVQDPPRAAPRRTFTALQRVQISALACSLPRAHGKPWPRWSGEKLAQVAIEQHIVTHIAPGTIRAWLRQDKIKPWRYHSWQRSTDPHFVDKAGPVLDLYEHAPPLAAQR